MPANPGRPNTSLKPLLRLKPYLRPYAWLLVGSFLLAIPLSAIRTAPAPLVKYIVDDLFQSRSEQKLLIFPLLVVGLYVANFVVRFAHYYLLRIVIARVNQQLKNELFEHLLGLSADYFTAQSTGTLISRVGVGSAEHRRRAADASTCSCASRSRFSSSSVTRSSSTGG